MKIDKLQEFNNVFGGDWVWKILKEVSHTKQRSPKFLHIRNAKNAEPMCLDDHSVGKRIAINLKTKQWQAIHVSAGENAICNRGKEGIIFNVPEGCILVDLEYNDYYRSFSVTVTSPLLNLTENRLEITSS